MDKLTQKDLRYVRQTVNAVRRHWVFTLNNPQKYVEDADKFIDHLNSKCRDRLRYAVFQLEKGDEGTPHYQGYLEFSQTVRMKWLFQILYSAAHVEARVRTREAARNYCMKHETREKGPWEYGVFKAGGSGSRNDLREVSDMVLAGSPIKEIANEFPVQFIKYHKGISKLISLNIEVRTVAPTIILCFGKTGTGKTKWAYDHYPKLYKKPCDSRWFDTYIGQKCLLLDDFAGASSKVSLNYTLQLLDRYPMLVEVKGDYVNLQSTTVVITTNLHPKTWYNYEKRAEQFNALTRRFHKVLWFSEFGKKPMLCSVDTFFKCWWEDCADEVYLIAETEDETESSEVEMSSAHTSSDETPPFIPQHKKDEENTSTEPDDNVVIDLTSSSSDDEESVDSCLDLFL